MTKFRIKRAAKKRRSSISTGTVETSRVEGRTGKVHRLAPARHSAKVGPLFVEGSNVEEESSEDEQENRALELEAIGDRNAGDRVRACRNRASAFPKSWCRDRSCPTCAKRQSREHQAWTFVPAVKEMSRPTRVIISAVAKQLADAIDRLRAGVADVLCVRLRHLVPHMIGAIEISPIQKRHGLIFNVHCHAFFDDVRGDLRQRVERLGLNAKWKKVTKGSIKFEVDALVRAEEITEAVRYALKWWTWCPRTPCDRILLRAWRRGRDHRKRILGWGFRGKRARRAREGFPGVVVPDVSTGRVGVRKGGAAGGESGPRGAKDHPSRGPLSAKRRRAVRKC